MKFRISKLVSSSENNNNNAWNQNFNNGNQNSNNKNNTNNWVVPVRRFKIKKLILKDSYNYLDILRAYLDCRKNKRYSDSAILFEFNFEENLSILLEEINSNNYQIGQSKVFVVTRPKPREIWAADFRDRVVHHLIYNEINPYFEKRFIEDTFSCIKTRGTLAASNRLQDFHRSITNNYDTDCYYFKFDLKNFFVSINKDILWQEISSKIENLSSLTSSLIQNIIYNDPTINPIINSTEKKLSLIPPHKSLWNARKNKGLPIGNLTSQFFSNVYLNPLDQFVKHNLKAKSYLRYVDDAIILSRDKSYLENCLEEINNFVTTLDLETHPEKCFIEKASKGMDFVGYIIKPYRKYTRKTTINNLKYQASKSWKDISLESVNSLLGITIHTNSYNIRKQILENLDFPTIITSDEDCTKVIKLY